MTIRSKAQFENIYLTSSGTWPDNSTGEITPQDLRAGLQDFFDSQTSNWYADTSGIIASDGSGLVGVDFNPNLAAPAWKEGRIFYDQLNHCLAVYNDASGVILQVGQETYVRIINQTATEISNGTVVELVSAGNAYPSVRPAIAAAGTDPHVIGFATHDIAAGAQGFVTINGLINDINTSPFSVGDLLYLSPTTSGAFTNVFPEAPVPAIHVGSVIVDHATAGRILAHIVNNPELEAASNVNGTAAQEGYILGYNAASGYWDPTDRLNTSGGFKFGDVGAGNYTEFEEDTGFNISYGSGLAWEDLRFPAFAQNVDVANGRIDYDYTNLGINFQYNARYNENEQLSVIAQMPHGKKMGTDVDIHVHWAQTKDYIPNVLIEYRWYNNGDPIPTGWTQLTMPSGMFTYTSGTLAQISDIGDITPPSGEAVSSILEIKLFRDVDNETSLFADVDAYNTGGDTDWLLKEFDVHYQIDTRGSRQEYIK